MMYFEDYMEMIEGLPQEVMEKLTQVRQLDLAVDNMVQPLGARIAELFGRCAAGSVDADWRAREHQAICQQFAIAQGHSDEKLALAKHLLDTVARLRRRLDTELEKFKLELEADHAGVTSSIEEKVLSDGVEAGHPVANGHAEATDAPLLAAAPASPSVLSANHHRRHSPPSSVGSCDTPRRGLKRSRSSFFGLEALGIADLDGADSLAAFFDDTAVVEAQRQGVGADDDGGDDNRRYCVCQDVSHGEMIACENPDCPFEWFHFSCVGLTVAPKGSWYCPRCRVQKRHRLK